jgi:Taurine catabolism dioxygenase TauD, TfdA family
MQERGRHLVKRFGTASRREYARPCLPVVDPAAWEPEDIRATDAWAYHFSSADLDEIAAAIELVRRKEIPIVAMTAADFPLPRLAAVIADARNELLDGRGFVYFRGLPVTDMTQEQAAIAYFGVGHHIGRPVSQNADGHLLGHVKDYGGRSIDDLNTRGYQTTAELGFHADHCDYVGLLCLRTAKSGGASRFASSVTLYNRMLAQRPDLVEVLCRDFHYSRAGEVPPGKNPWYTQPVFSFHEGFFSARGVSSYIFKAQKIPGVPPFTPAQQEAIALFRKTVAECAVDLDFEPGDIQLLHNHVVLHSRSAYEDWPDPACKRHLLRLWLRDSAGRPLPPSVRENFIGVEVAGFTPKVPLDVAVA